MSEMTEEQKAAMQKEQGIRNALSNENSREWVWNLLTHCGIYRNSFVNDACATAYNEGMRNVGLRLLADIERFAPGSYDLMKKEAKERNERSTKSDE